MLQVILTLIIIFLAIQALPVSLGIQTGRKPANALVLVAVIAIVQVFTFWGGLKIGESFMYLMKGFKGVIVFIGFLLIGIRMLMEVFNIRKGERTYTIDKPGHMALASLAQGVNSFLVGLLLYFIPHDEEYLLYLLATSSIVVSLIGMMMKPEKVPFALASLLYTISGLIMLFSAVYFSFFYL